MNRELRAKAIKKRKNFFVTFLVIVALWCCVLSIVYFINPDTFVKVFVLLLVLFLALFMTLSTFFENKRRGAIVSLAFVLFLLLRYFQIGTILNLILIVGVTVTFEIYFLKKQ